MFKCLYWCFFPLLRQRNLHPRSSLPFVTDYDRRPTLKRGLYFSPTFISETLSSDSTCKPKYPKKKRRFTRNKLLLQKLDTYILNFQNRIFSVVFHYSTVHSVPSINILYFDYLLITRLIYYLRIFS